MTLELRGAPVAKTIRAQATEELRRIGRSAVLASIVEPSAADAVAYSAQLGRAAEKIGIAFAEHAMDAYTPALVAALNEDAGVTAIIVHEPSPEGLRETVDRCKDPESPVPCTALAVLELLDFYDVTLDSADVVVVGRSRTVGRPLAGLLLDRRPGPTVTVCHSGTRDLRAHTGRADVVIAAAGAPGLIDAVKDGAVVVDVGTNMVGGTLLGDVDARAAASRCRAITPVPGGVGPVTVACLLRSVVRLLAPPIPPRPM